MVRIPIENVEVKPARVYVDLDTYGDANLPNVSCLPSNSTNEAMTIRTLAVNGENALCVHNESEKFFGVLGTDYDNCITESGLLYASERKTGDIHSPVISPEGKRRMALLIAQVHDCYVMQGDPNPASAYLWHSDGAFDRGLWSALFFDKTPPYGTRSYINADIDKSGEFEPTVGIVTAAGDMSDDFVAVDVNFRGVCAIFHSEVEAPYGEDRVCLSFYGDIEVDDPFVKTYFDEQQMRVNLGNVLNAFDFSSTEISQSIVAAANGLHLPSSDVPKGQQLESKNWLLRAFKKDAQRTMDACEQSKGLACGTPW